MGAGLLSQNISQQEYSRLFEANRLGLLTSTEIRSDGQFREIASHYGLVDRFSYTLDLDYQRNEGTRPNNDLDRIEWYSQFKYQLTDCDSVFLLAKYQDYESGDNFQHYDPANASRTLRFKETQAPIVLGALHREWRPGVHTTFLAGFLQAQQQVRGGLSVLDVRTNPPSDDAVFLERFDKIDYRANFQAFTAELNQVLQAGTHALVTGGRFVSGELESSSTVDDPVLASFFSLPVRAKQTARLERWSVYAYDTWQLFPSFQLTAGLTYDRLSYPANFQTPPVSPGSARQQRLSPKAAFLWQAKSNLTVRGLYSRSLGGVSFDESVRLEPVQLAGFSQTFRNVISEAEVGSVAAPRYEVAALALDLKLWRGAYVGLAGQRLRSSVDRKMGAFVEDGTRAFPSSVQEQLRYTEWSGGITVHQLLGDEWSLGASYRYTDSELHLRYPTIPTTLPRSPTRTEAAALHTLGLRVFFQHPSGVFARAEAEWLLQDNDGYGYPVYSAPRPGQSVYQLNLLAGYRFWQRRGEVTVGCLNLTGEDYRLNSLTPYQDRPRERVWMARVKLEF